MRPSPQLNGHSEASCQHPRIERGGCCNRPRYRCKGRTCGLIACGKHVRRDAAGVYCLVCGIPVVSLRSLAH